MTKELMESDNLIKPAQIGKILEGKIIGKGRSSLFLDLGPLGAGIIYGKEFQGSKNEIKNLKTGDTLLVKIIDLENEEGYIELSLSQASEEIIWERLRQKKEDGEMIMVKVSGANKGGLLAEVSGIAAFLPVSQLLADHYPRVEKGDSAKILQELQKFVGQEMEVKIFDLEPRDGKLILSEKAKENEKIKEILKNYKVGDVVDGEITGVTDFGVFVRFNKKGADPDFIEGLIHISELDWQLIENPADIVKVGDKMKTKIISIVEDRVSLSLKALKKDPWEGISEKYKKGDSLEGKVTKFNPYGAFVEISPKIQGLCHISEFGTKLKMEEKLKMGKKYKFQVLSIEPKEHRMSLKLAEETKELK
ncbi:MAG: 30S ribosomal protein S1 [Candidatus Nealsonbacteria bacterium RBG_13_42_11]|uniref:30S ribosomal protein S1 n=1 Tax=Candidatus Nealsonbacteria bacterium RBG_13_42_11 TaxID=1801663 RepID=A0A1G2DYB4_9BACT|nr:MAG: 30S ribosomal protein S1 [Candidatus Nealsonbacteria bacterium RBG_13_42_11]